MYLLPFVKYPANPPAIGHTFTITTRGHLYLTMVAGSLILLGLAVWLARKLAPRFGMTGAVVLAAVAFLVVYGVLIGVLPSLGNLAANVAHTNQFGYARAATETPQPITNILSTPLVDRRQDHRPGPDRLPRLRRGRAVEVPLVLAHQPAADLDRRPRWSSAALLERYLTPPQPRAKTEPSEREPALP